MQLRCDVVPSNQEQDFSTEQAQVDPIPVPPQEVQDGALRTAFQRCHGPFALRYFGGLEYLRQNGAPRFWVSEELVLQENEPAEVPRFDGRS